jgi:hypothetical protein
VIVFLARLVARGAGALWALAVDLVAGSVPRRESDDPNVLARWDDVLRD